MAFTVEEFQDLIRLLQERPEWRADLRRLVLSDELLALPELVRELVQAQQRTEVRVGRLEESVESLRAETERRFQELATAQLTLTGHMDDMRAAMLSLEEHTARLRDDVGELKGSDLERRYRERPFAYFQRLIRQAHTLSGDELNAILDRAVTAGQLTGGGLCEVVVGGAMRPMMFRHRFRWGIRLRRRLAPYFAVPCPSLAFSSQAIVNSCQSP